MKDAIVLLVLFGWIAAWSCVMIWIGDKRAAKETE